MNGFRSAFAEAYLSTCQSSDLPLADKELAAYNASIERCGLPAANNGLFRSYGKSCSKDGMGAHSDTFKTMHPNSLVTVRRTGTGTRHFAGAFSTAKWSLDLGLS